MTWVAAGMTTAEIIAAEAAAAAAAEAAAVAAAEATAAAAAETAAAAVVPEAAAVVPEVATTVPEATGILEAAPGATPPPAEPMTPAGLEQVTPAGSTPPPPAEPVPPTEFSQAELDAINQGQLDAANSGPSPYEPTASNNGTQLVEKATQPPTTGTENVGQGLRPNPPGIGTQTVSPGSLTGPTQPYGLNPGAPGGGISGGPLGTGVDPSLANLSPTPVEPNPFLQGAKDTLSWMDANPFKTGAAAYLGLQATGALNQKPQTFNQQKSTFNNPYHFSPNFKGSHPDANVYKPSYAGYAAGGITQASVPTPGLMDGNQAANVNFMGKDMYPMSQQNNAHYATPSQMPTSAQQTMASYEQNTNPLTGETSMAQGGQVPGYGLGGIIEQLMAQVDGNHSKYNYDKDSGKYSEVGGPSYDYNKDSGKYSKMAEGGIARYYRGDLATSTGGKGDVYGATQRFLEMYDPHSKYDAPKEKGDAGIFYDSNPSTRDKIAPEAAQIRANAIDKRANLNTGAKYYKPSVSMGQLNLRPQNNEKDDGTTDSVLAARGGIMQASLGGYAAGGNPRLLKGPGDGMSDNIPATIGGRQPARLADGEFVVPADVVSHLGNGSTDAGAKKLHGMMDKVRMDRTGKKKQAPAVKAGKYIPK
jgi:hypothetical protein